MSDSIVSIAQDFTLIVKQEAEIKRLKEENVHLKELLTHGSNINTFIEPEFVIIHKQIAILEEQSMVRALTTDEVKRMKMLVETRIMLEDRQDPKDVIDSSGYSPEELLALATSEEK